MIEIPVYFMDVIVITIFILMTQFILTVVSMIWGIDDDFIIPFWVVDIIIGVIDFVFLIIFTIGLLRC